MTFDELVALHGRRGRAAYAARQRAHDEALVELKSRQAWCTFRLQTLRYHAESRALDATEDRERVYLLDERDRVMGELQRMGELAWRVRRRQA